MFVQAFHDSYKFFPYYRKLTGAIALTLTPLDAHSMAKDLVRLSTAARAAPEWLNTNLYKMTSKIKLSQFWISWHTKSREETL